MHRAEHIEAGGGSGRSDILCTAHSTRALAVCAALVAISLDCRPATADVMYLKNNPPVYGRLVSQDEQRIAFRQRMAAGHYVDRTFRLEDVEALIVTIDLRRLEALQPQRPQDYRDLAEELAVKRRDPEAHDLAIRLYLLAAYLGQDQVRRSSFLGLISLARDESERRRTAALAYLSDPNHDPSWLRAAGDASVAEDDNRAKRDLQLALRQLRSGRPLEAVQTVKDDAIKSLMGQYKAICTWDELYQACLADELSRAQLQRLMALEISLTRSLGSAELTQAPDDSSWADLMRLQPPAVDWVTFENLTEFDPRQAVFRAGSWTEAP